MREPASQAPVGAGRGGAPLPGFALAGGGQASAWRRTHDVTARFKDLSGLWRGSDGRLAGVRAGLDEAIEDARAGVDLLILFGSVASAGSAQDTPDAAAAAEASDSSGGVK